MPGNVLTVSNRSEVTRLDGVYIIDQAPPTRVRAINGNVGCVIGEFEWGPVDVPTPVGSGTEFVRLFGGIGPDVAGALYKGALSMYGKVKMGPLRVIRLSNGTQATATLDLDDATVPTAVVRVAGRYPGERGNQYSATVQDATDAVATHFDLVIKRNSVVIATLRNLDLSAINDGDEFPQSVGNNDVKVTRLALGDGRAVNVADQSLTSGSNGTFVDTDYTGSTVDVRGIELIKSAQSADIRYFWVAERGNATVNAAMIAAAVASEKTAIISGATGDAKATTLTAVAALTRTDRAIYVGTSVRVYVAEANGGMGGLVDVLGNSFMGSILTSIAPGRNPAGPGENQVHLELLSGIREIVDTTLNRSDYETFRAQRVCAIEVSPLGGFQFRSGVTMSLIEGKQNIARRSIADYIIFSGGAFLLQFQNQPIWSDLKDMIRSALAQFFQNSQTLKLLPRKQDLQAGLVPFSISFPSTPDDEAAGILIVQVRVRTFSSADFIVFEAQIGEGVEITLSELQSAV